MTRPSPVPPAVRGWCPGALRPMESGDGLIVRLRITGGIVPAAVLREIAGLAARHGNGLIDLSQRANLQLRGIRPGTLEPLLADLDRLGLLDADPAGEAVRNVIGPPLAGLDPDARVAGAALVRDLEAMLARHADLHALPDKFGFVVDDGGRLPLGAVAADVRLTGVAGGVHLAIGGDAATAAPVAIVPEVEAAAAAAALARSFLALREGTGARRMRALVAAVGADRVRRAAGFDGPPPAPAIRAATGAREVLSGRFGLGAAAPFGRLDAAQAERIAGLAAADVRLTPFRAVLLPGAAAGAAEALAGAGLIVEAADPRLAVAACPGAPACPSGAAETRLAAAALAPAVAGADGVVLHVSGCAKGCARPQPTAVTLVGNRGGYDLVLDGRADAAPIRGGLGLAAARAAIETRLSTAGDRP